MYANIAILRNAQNIDQLYTYSISEGDVVPGRRVLVPFGTSGLVEGVVISMQVEAPEFEVKDIKHVFDASISLSDFDLKVVDYIREKCLASYAETLQLFLPSGVVTTQIKKYRATQSGRESLDAMSDKDKNIFSQVISFDVLPFDKIETSQSPKAKAQNLSKMVAKGWLKLEYDYVESVKDRYLEQVELIGDINAYRSTIPQNHTSKLKFCDLLLESPVIDKRLLSKEHKINKSVLDRFIEDGVVRKTQIEDRRIPAYMNSFEDKSGICLNTSQKSVYDEIVTSYESGETDDFLIHGVTGSGKTEVYAELIENMIERGKKTVLLVPEISLTPQIVSRFASRFGKENIALLHSKISLGERHDQWKAIRQGDYQIIIGARSAVFAPSDDIGLIIIDEEHENTYRSEKRPRYETHDVALMRMRLLGGMVVSGSATPSLTAYYEAKNHKRKLLKLESRYNLSDLPELEIVDMRRELEDGNLSMLSRRLFSAIEERLQRGEQSIIFLNRKGHSTFVSCRSCGFTMACPNCDVTLTYFKSEKSVRCNYCGYESFVPKKCPSCESKYFKYFGVGTEKVEETLNAYFKEAVIARMDRTTTSRKGHLEEIIADVESEKVDILIGTQMVAKGFDFKNVTLVGILSADLMFNFPSFQAAERTYQLVTQVAGRSGRGEKPGEVILQTYTPDHYAINVSDYDSFYEIEMSYRQNRHYPPYVNLINLLISSKYDEEAKKYAEKAHVFLKRNFLKKDLQNKIELYPASPALLKKIDGQYRWQILIKCPPELLINITRYFKILEDEFRKIGACRIQIDLDARNIL